MLRIFADENVASVVSQFGRYGRVAALPGREITRKTLERADVLLIRSVTRVTSDLLEGTPVRFVGSATAGTDHVDVDALRSLGIHFAYAPGSNAPSVCDYVITAMIDLAMRERRSFADLHCAVIGCGAVGSQLAARLEGCGLTVLRSDPPLHDELTRKNLPSPFVDTDAALAAADVVTIHVPLHDEPGYSTFGLLDADRMRLLRENAWIINTSRGLVVDEPAQIAWLDRHPGGRAVVDVWAGEPNPSCELVRRASFGTAHVAGYAVEGKLRATHMLRDALSSWLNEGRRLEPFHAHSIDIDPPPANDSDAVWLRQLVHSLYDIESDHSRLSSICSLPQADRPAYFDQLRRDYPPRHEFSSYLIPRSAVPQHLLTTVREGLMMRAG